MIIRCYGARGSIPVSGEEYLKYGGDSTCFEIRSSNDAIIIVDAGSGARRLGMRLIAEQRFDLNILFTHFHWDHILGFPFLNPIYEQQTTLNVMGYPTSQRRIERLVSRAISSPLFPVPQERVKASINYCNTPQTRFHIDSIEIYPIPLSHPNSGFGYKFVEDGKSFVFLTDNELHYPHEGGRSFEEYVDFAKDADLLVHDAAYTTEQYCMARGWGHSTDLDALNLALTARVEHFGLFHHSQEQTDAKQDAMVDRCREIISDRGVDMECSALTQTTEFRL
jgi:ribonuclease BN (tRNA processing enzyme)